MQIVLFYVEIITYFTRFMVSVAITNSSSVVMLITITLESVVDNTLSCPRTPLLAATSK